jgi:hypothetical protein
MADVTIERPNRGDGGAAISASDLDSVADTPADAIAGREFRTVSAPDAGGGSDIDGGGLGGDSGRPRVGGSIGGGDGGDGGDYYLNADGSIKRNKDGSPRRKRAARGSGGSRGNTGKTSKARPLHIGGIEALLLSTHAMAAAFVSEMKLEKSEAHQLAEAISDVAKFYPNAVLTDQQVATINLFIALAMVYGPRLYLISARMKEDRAKKAKPAGAKAQAAQPPAPVSAASVFGPAGTAATAPAAPLAPGLNDGSGLAPG